MTLDLSNVGQRKVFFEVHSGLPREAPGSRASSERALQMAAPLPVAARVLDIGCGPGAHTLHLAMALPSAKVTGVDLHAPYVAEAQRRALASGLADRVTVVVGDMKALPFPDHSFDLLWSEGSAYLMGVANALRAWKKLLAPAAKLAFSEAVWLRDNPPDEAWEFWQSYPAMTSISGCRTLAEKAGYRVLGELVLPSEDWWAYYQPMRERIRELREKYVDDANAQVALDGCEHEISVYERHSAYYGYCFFVLTN